MHPEDEIAVPEDIEAMEPPPDFDRFAEIDVIGDEYAELLPDEPVRRTSGGPPATAPVKAPPPGPVPPPQPTSASRRNHIGRSQHQKPSEKSEVARRFDQHRKFKAALHLFGERQALPLKIMVVLWDLANPEGLVSIGNGDLAAQAGASTKSLTSTKNAMKQLRDMGLLEVSQPGREGYRTPTYRLLLD